MLPPHGIGDDRLIPLDLALPLISFVLFLSFLSLRFYCCPGHLPSVEIIALCLASLPWFWRSNLDPHPCVANMLPTGPSPQPRDDHLEFTKESTEFGAKIHCELIAPDPSKTCLDMSVVCSISAHWQVSWRTAAWS